MNKNQRAMVAAKLATMKLGDNQHHKEGMEISTPSVSASQAADMLIRRRLADEYDAAQERGEVASAGDNQHNKEVVPSGNDLGLSRKDIHEARLIRDAENADPGIVRRSLDEVHVPSGASLSQIHDALLRLRDMANEPDLAKRLNRAAAALRQNAPGAPALNDERSLDEIDDLLATGAASTPNAAITMVVASRHRLENPLSATERLRRKFKARTKIVPQNSFMGRQRPLG